MPKRMELDRDEETRQMAKELISKGRALRCGVNQMFPNQSTGVPQ